MSQSAPVRLFLLWRDPLLAESLTEALAARPDVQLKGAADQLPKALSGLQRVDADVILLEVGEPFPLCPAERQVRILRESLPERRLLPFGLVSPEAAVGLLEAGADGYVRKSSGLDDLLRAIHGVQSRRPVCDLEVALEADRRIRELTRRLPSPRPRKSTPSLTPRETEVLHRLARGLTNKEVARSLSIRTATVKNHVHNLVKKLDVRNRREAVRYALEAGLLEELVR